MPVHALQHLGRALLSQIPEDPASAIITVKSESVPTLAANGQKRTSEGLVYDPATVYVLELVTVLALRDDESMRALGQDIAGALQNVLRDGSNYHQTMVSRTVFYTLNLLHASYVSRTPYRRNQSNSSRNTHFSEYQLYYIQYRVLDRICWINPHLSFSRALATVLKRQVLCEMKSSRHPISGSSYEPSPKIKQ
jgi:hypothetical protein